MLADATMSQPEVLAGAILWAAVLIIFCLFLFGGRE